MMPDRAITETARTGKGFSLVEVLVALAITSLASLALFQSIGLWVTISGKATQAAERAVTGIIHDTQLRTIVAGLTPGWPDREEEVFIGTPTYFSGLTSNQLHLESPALAVVTVELKAEDDSVALNYLAFETAWTMKTFPQAETRFEYLGTNGQWYPAWPPAQTPEPGPFTDASFYNTPQLPLAVRLTITMEAETTLTIATVSNDPVNPIRNEDVAREFFDIR